MVTLPLDVADTAIHLELCHGRRREEGHSDEKRRGLPQRLVAVISERDSQHISAVVLGQQQEAQAVGQPDGEDRVVQQAHTRSVGGVDGVDTAT